MLTCKEATRLCSEALDRPLGLRERLTLHAHLMICSGCTNFNRQMGYLRGFARAYAAGAGTADEGAATEAGKRNED